MVKNYCIFVGISIIWFSTRDISWTPIRFVHCTKYPFHVGCMGIVQIRFCERICNQRIHTRNWLKTICGKHIGFHSTLWSYFIILYNMNNSIYFQQVPAHSFLWGYDDPLIEKSKTWSPNPPKFDKFGMLTTVNRNYFPCIH